MAEKTSTNSMVDISFLREDDINFFGIDLADDKAFRMFIKLTEGICRRTIEYQLWAKRTKMLAHKQNEDPSRDDSSFCPICELSYEFVDPESHHHPVTLFNICVNIFQNWIDDNLLSEKQPLDLVYEVMQLHAMGKVEHVVLCKHCHEKYHNGLFEVKEHVDKIINFKRARELEEDEQNMPESVFNEKQKRLAKSKKLKEESFLRKQRMFTDGITEEDLINDQNSLLSDLNDFLVEENNDKTLVDFVNNSELY